MDTPNTLDSFVTPATFLITGASRGLGLALARRLAHEGHRLILNARGSDALHQAVAELSELTTPDKLVGIAGDVADPQHRQALLQAAQAFGGLDVLVNNASILGPSPQPALREYPLEILEQVYRINTLAPLALIQTLHPAFKTGVRVVNISSDAGVVAYEGWGGYGSSKAALEQLSAVLAAENPDWKVYWVDPGDMRTAMHQAAFPDEDISDRPEPESSVPGFIELLKGHLVSGRYSARALVPAVQEVLV